MNSMKKVGVCIQDLGPSQLAYDFIRNANQTLQNRYDLSIFAFYENLTRCVMGPSFGTFNLTEVFGFDGVLITTSLILTHQTLKFPRPSKRIYYVNDIEWGKGIPVEFCQSVFRSGVELVARCEDYAKLVENNFNVPCKVSDFNVEKFI